MSHDPPCMRPSRTARFIIADDHELARAGFRTLLSGIRGLELVGEASDGRQALELCRSLRPDLILMDVRMPDMDGLAVTRAIKQESSSTSVILFTMYENPAYVLEALKAGAAAYVLKGATKREILSAVRQVLAGESLLHPDLILRLLGRLSGGGPEAAPMLTQRERDVLRLVAAGQTNPEIGETLGVTASTVKTHVGHLMAKLKVSDRTQAAVRAVELGLVASKPDNSGSKIGRPGESTLDPPADAYRQLEGDTGHEEDGDDAR